VFLTNEWASMSLCRHGLGNSGDKVCFIAKKLDAKTCGIYHRGDEFILDPNSFYILAKTSPGLQAFAAPVLDASRLTANYVDHHKSLNQDANNLFRLFALVKLNLENAHKNVGAIQVGQLPTLSQSTSSDSWSCLCASALWATKIRVI
jgi:hypothetical protein